jgi:type I restriction enzyme M protein
MSNASAQIVNKLWSYCHVLRDDGLSYGDYVEQLTLLLFLKMAHERTEPPFNQKAIVPKGLDWSALLSRDGDALEVQYRHTLDELGRRPGMLGVIFKKTQNKIGDPAKLRRLVADLIDKESWTSLDADVKGDAYEGLLEKNAAEGKGGAGQYFTPRALIKAIVDVMDPRPGERICDPAAGTGGFLLAAHDHIARTPGMSKDQKKALKHRTLVGFELAAAVARLCAMNLLLHGIEPEEKDAESEKKLPVRQGDSLGSDPGERFEVVLSNPPFGKKSSVLVVGDDGEESRETLVIEREDFWATTSNKQLNFVQHIKTITKVGGRAAIVVPDNVLFEGGAGETIRRKLLHECDVHTMLRLPTGIFYAQGVKANVLFLDRKAASETPWTKKLWIYDLRTNEHFTLKTNPLRREDLDEFVACYKTGARHERTPTWSEKNPTGRWRAYEYGEIVARDKCSLDIFWLRDESLEASSNLPAPGVIAAEIVDDLRAALEQFEAVAADLAAGSGEADGARGRAS